MLILADDAQIFDLNFTIGEVGLSEIKLTHKYNKEQMSANYRTHPTDRENRFTKQTHTISSVSQYSSTNSINSCNSSRLNQRSINKQTAPVSGRKKRIAPRPPSQICKFKDTELIGMNGITELNQSDLIRQNFHVSSPNLSIYDSNKSNSSSILSTDVIASSPNNKRDVNRPLSMQLRSSKFEDHSLKYLAGKTTRSRNHSNTSSGALTSQGKENSLSAPQLRKCPPAGRFN